MTPKDYYRNYIADDRLMELNFQLIQLIHSCTPNHVFEFGCGTGKHLKKLNDAGIEAHGIDISPGNVSTAIYRHGLTGVNLGDESQLRHYCNYDVVFTCSVLDHIEEIENILEEFCRIANKFVIFAEPQYENREMFYFSHDYEGHGFTRLQSNWTSPDDGVTYYLWIKALNGSEIPTHHR